MIDDLLNQDCSIIKVERDEYGDYIPSDPILTKCRANESFQIVKNQAGEDVVSSIQLWLPKDVDITRENIDKRRINYRGKQFSIISVRNRIDLFGNPIFKVVNV